MLRHVLLALPLLLPCTFVRAADELESEQKNLTFVGFQQLKDASRVYVKTTEPVKYTIDKSRPDVVVLVLDNTKVPVLNNTRPLDTQYFDSPVSLVEIKTVEGPSPSVRIEIHTRSRGAPYKPTQKDTLLALDFTK